MNVFLVSLNEVAVQAVQTKELRRLYQQLILNGYGQRMYQCIGFCWHMTPLAMVMGAYATIEVLFSMT